MSSSSSVDPVARPTDSSGADAPTADDLSAQQAQEIAAVFGLLSATVRVHILWLLSAGERDVGSLAEAVEQSVPTVSNHLAKLKLAGLVRNRREGKRQVYVVDDTNVVELIRLARPYRERRAR